MRSRFDEQLQVFNNKLIRMGSLCEKMLNDLDVCIRKGIDENDFSENEYKVLRLGREIENMGMELLIRQQPVARDLRLVSSAFKIVYDFRRIATQILDVKELYDEIKVDEKTKETGLDEISKLVIKQLRGCVDSFVSNDIDLALSVIKDDDIIDNKFAEIKEAITEEIHNDAATSKGDYMDILMIAKYYEKIGDHSVDVAKNVYYAITSEKI